jgi:chromosome segregation ATPase
LQSENEGELEAWQSEYLEAQSITNRLLGEVLASLESLKDLNQLIPSLVETIQGMGSQLAATQETATAIAASLTLANSRLEPTPETIPEPVPESVEAESLEVEMPEPVKEIRRKRRTL